MKIIRKCLNCGNEYDSTDRKNASLYCGKECKDSHVANNVKDIFESVTEGLGQAVEMEAKEKLLGMVETKQKNKADELWGAIRLLHNQKASINDLITQSENSMKAEESKLSDIQHKMFLLDLTEQELLDLAKKQREILSRRSAYKNLLNVYRLIDKFQFEPEVSQAINYGKSYKLKNEEGSFSFGDVYSDFLEKQSMLIEEENKKAEEKSKEEESLKDLKEYIEKLHESPITGKMISTIGFAKNSLKDLTVKISQLESKAKAFRIDLNRSTITYYN